MIQTYAIYNLTNGALKCFMQSEPEHIDNSIQDGFGWVEVDAALDGAWHVDIESKELVADAVDTRSLNDAKTLKNAEINAARLAANQSSFTYAGKAIAVDPLSRSDIDATNGMVSLNDALPPSFPGGWKAIDNTYVSIPDVATWKLFYAAMVAQGMSNFGHAQTLKTSLAAATTLADVDAIQW